MTDRILRPKEACEYLGIGIATLWRLEQKGELKGKRRISRGAVGWMKSDLDKFLENARVKNVEATQ